MGFTPAEVGCLRARASQRAGTRAANRSSRAGFALACAGLAWLLLVPGVARARWGESDWGELLWGEAVPIPAVGSWGLGLLGVVLVAAGVAWRRRAVRSGRDRS
jgi:hypothetical protein